MAGAQGLRRLAGGRRARPGAPPLRRGNDGRLHRVRRRPAAGAEGTHRLGRRHVGRQRRGLELHADQIAEPISIPFGEIPHFPVSTVGVLPTLLDNFSPKDQAGGDDTDDSDINPTGTDIGFTDVFNIASNVISMSHMDAGILRFRTPTPTRTQTPISIGNFVWDDLDADGIKDAGEPGMAGVTVQLWNSTKTQLIASAVTNASGNYTVVAPLPGNWKSGGYLERLPQDPWGNPYLYLQPGRHGEIDVFSQGADGQPGGEANDADIGNWML